MSTVYCDDSNPSPSASRPECDVSEVRKVDPMTMPLIGDTARGLSNLVSNLKVRLYLIQKSPQLLDKHLTELEHFANYLDALVQRLMTANDPELDGQMQALKPLNLN